MRRASAVLLPLAGGAALVAAWYLVKGLWRIPSLVLPSPGEILAAAWQERATLLSAALITGRGALLGFLAAVGLGFLIAFLVALSPSLHRALTPYLLMLQMTPVIILAPVFALWLGQGLPAIVAITFMICFFPVTANATLGFASTDRNLRELFALYRASRLQEMIHLRIPAAMPQFLTGMKIAGTLAPIGAITGDFLVGSAPNGAGGIGFMTVTYFSQLKTPALYATGLIACALGFLFVGAVGLLQKLLLRRWHESAAPSP